MIDITDTVSDRIADEQWQIVDIIDDGGYRVSGRSITRDVPGDRAVRHVARGIIEQGRYQQPLVRARFQTAAIATGRVALVPILNIGLI